jgi:DNA-directed RNA polymerase specialized sigma subunit
MTERQYSAHEWLNESFRIMKSELRIKEEYAMKLKPDDGAIDYSKDRIQNSNPGSQEERIISYSMAMAEVDKVRAKILRTERERQKAINLLPRSDYRAILTARYLNHYSWKQISRKLNIAESYMYRKHLKALDEIYDLIPEVMEE